MPLVPLFWYYPQSGHTTGTKFSFTYSWNRPGAKIECIRPFIAICCHLYAIVALEGPASGKICAGEIEGFTEFGEHDE